MAKTTAKPVPPDGDPPDANHPETMSLKTTTWLEEPDYDPPGKASKKKMETRKKFQQRFRDAVGSTTYQWNYYTVYGWYHFDDPARFVTIWKKYNEKTTEAKLQKAQYIWKVYQFHRNNDLEVPPIFTRELNTSPNRISESTTTDTSVATTRSARNLQKKLRKPTRVSILLMLIRRGHLTHS
jgi:hypothetical protein